MIKKLISFFAAVAFVGLSLTNVSAFNFYEGALNADAVYMIDHDSGIPIVEKNINNRRSPASLTKIVTFLVTYENCPNIDETKVTVSKEALDMVDPESSGSPLKEGEEYSVNDLLHCMMISSSGYCAVVLAHYIGGGNIEKFVEMMNSKVQELGCNDTHFENPDGIHSENQYTTASDMYKITDYAMKNQVFLDIVAKSEHRMFGDGRDPVVTTNQLMRKGGKFYLPYVKGIKTGYTREAGRCLISYAVKNGRTYVAVVMGAPTEDDSGHALADNAAMVDSVNLYNWAFGELKPINICEKYYPLTQTNVRFVWGRDTVVLSAQKDINISLPKNINKDDISLKYDVPEQIDAPVKKGDIIGKATVMYGGEKLLTFNLVSSENLEKNYILVIFSFLHVIFSSRIFMIAFCIFLLVLSSYIVLVLRYNSRKRKKNKVVNINKFKK